MTMHHKAQRTLLSLTLLTGVLALPASADELMACNQNRQVILLDVQTGLPLQATPFIQLVHPTTGQEVFGFDAQQVGDEIWVSGTHLDVVLRYTLDGVTQLGALTTGITNPHGMTVAAGRVWIACEGAASSPLGAITEYKPDGTWVATHLARPARDVIEFGERLVSSHRQARFLTQRTLGGEAPALFQSMFGTGQAVETVRLALRPSTGNLLVASWSGSLGVHEVNAQGTPVAFHPFTAPSGFPAAVLAMRELPSGELLWSGYDGKSPGLYRYDAALGTSTWIASVIVTGFSLRTTPYGNRECTALTNSSGEAAQILPLGSASVAADDFQMALSGVPAGEIATVHYGFTSVSLPFGNGLLCTNLGGSTAPFAFRGALSTAWNSFELPVRFNQTPATLGPIASGTTWVFQGAFRDPAFGGLGFSSSDAYRVTFQL